MSIKIHGAYNLTTAITIPEAFRLAHYRLTLEAVDDLHLPPFKGSALRGGFGHTFKRLACMEPRRCDKQCRRGNACAYGYVFETTPPQDSQTLSNFSDVPRPFVIAPAQDRRELIRQGERLILGLTLIGQGIEHLPYFLVVFKEMGQNGLGRNRGRFRLATVNGVEPDHGRPVPVYNVADDTIRADDLALTGQAVAARAAGLPTDRLTLEFLTPTRLKQRGRWVWEGPPFEVLIRTLLGRVSSLSYFHCGQRLETDFRELIDQAASIKMVAVESHWEDWQRVSGRQKRHIKMGGLVGRVTYEGELEPYLALLTLGELIHVGKSTVFGNGQYRVVRGVS